MSVELHLHDEPVPVTADAPAVTPCPVVRFPTAHERPSAAQPPPPLREVIGDVLREERHDQSRTLADVAGQAAVSLPYLSEVERGRKEVSSDLLTSISGALGLDLADVLERAAQRLRSSSAGRGELCTIASIRMQRHGGAQLRAA